jgi:WD40 repeat protein
MSVYIIYAREDHVVAHVVAAQLEERGLPVSFDHRQHSEGSGLRARLERKMREARLVLLVMTPEAAKSAYCREELDHAARLGKQIVAMLPAALPPDFAASMLAMPSLTESLLLYEDAAVTGSGFAASMERVLELAADETADATGSGEGARWSARFRSLRERLQEVAARHTAAYRLIPPILIALLSVGLLFHVTFQQPSLLLVFALSLAIIAVTAWRFWRDMKKERAPFGTVWARSRLAWASVALLVPMSVGYALYRQSHEGPARVIASVDAPVSAVAAGVTEAGEKRIAYATYDGWLYLADPDSPGATVSVRLTDGDVRPVTQLLWHNAARVIAVREGEVLRWSGEGDPVAIWTGESVPLVALDEGQRLMIVETRPLTKDDARYAALSRLTIRGIGLGFAATISDRDITSNYTFAITVADPLAETVDAIHIQAKPILPSAIAARGSGREAELLIGSGDGELIVCSEAAMSPDITVPSDVMAFGCGTAIPSGSASAITDITLSGDRGLTRHRDGSAVDWTKIGTEWRRGALPLPLWALRGHGGVVTSAAFSPDGRRIVTASTDRTARVWDAATGQQMLALAGHEAEVRSAAFSRDGTRIVTASSDNTARVWDAATGQQMLALAGHETEVWSAAFSPDGTRIVTASWDGTARVWDAATGQPLQTLAGHETAVSYAAYSPDGTRIVTASMDDTARVWDAATGQLMQILAGHETVVTSAVFSADGTRIVTASRDDTARVWDAATGQPIQTLAGHHDGVMFAAFSPDDTRIVTASSDNTARVWDAATGQPVLTFANVDVPLTSAVFSPDNLRIVTASRDAIARVWDATSAAQSLMSEGAQTALRTGRIRLPESDVELAAFRDHAPEIATLPDGRIVAGGWDGRVMIVDPVAAGAMAQADPAAWIASLWAPVGDTARTMFANVPGIGSANVWERVSAADRAIAIDRNPRAQTEAWFAVGSIIAMPREISAQPARDLLGPALEDLGLPGSVISNESGEVTMTIGGVDPTRWQVPTQQQQQADPDQTNDPDTYQPPQSTNPTRPQIRPTPQRQTPSSSSVGRTPTPPAPQPRAPPPMPVRERVLGSADISPLFAAESETACSANYTQAQLQSDTALATACVVQQLRQSGEYQYAELDYIARPAQAAPALGVSAAMRGQWAFGAGPGGANLSNLRWNGPIAESAAAADGVVVAVIDTGLALDHPAISGAAWLAPGYDMVSDPLMANDGDARDANPDDPGDRCNTGDPRAADSLHGTHVAGLVAAAGVGGLKLVPVRALGRCGGKLSDINDAIQWAAGVIPARDSQGAEVWNANPADIINLSFEVPVACPASLQNAIDQAVAAGAVVVAAAGNGGRDASTWSPGGCNNVVSVGASDARGAPAAYSNFGAGIDLYAPGGDLSRDDNGDGVKDGVVSWGEGSARCIDALTGETRNACRHVMTAGTSNAAALATAALAMLKAENPGVTNSDLVQQLRASSRESCVKHPNPRSRVACISSTGGSVRLLGGGAARAETPAQGAVDQFTSRSALAAWVSDSEDLEASDISTRCVRELVVAGDAVWAEREKQQAVVDEVRQALGLSGVIWAIPCEAIDAVQRARLGDISRVGQFVVYNPAWWREVVEVDRSTSVFVVAHEIAHLVNGDSDDPRASLTPAHLELVADEFAGCTLARMKLTIDSASELLKRTRSAVADFAYPSATQSLKALTDGFARCAG